MSDSTIGIKIANGEYYPILSETDLVRRRLILTTASDNQEKAQIEFFKAEENDAESLSFLGSLQIVDIEPSPKGKPEIELVLGIDAGGRLNAAVRDKDGGGSQTLDVSLNPPRGLEEDQASATSWGEDFPMEDSPSSKIDLTGDDSSSWEVREEEPPRRWGRLLLLAGIIVLILFLLFFFFVRGFPGQSNPPVDAGESSVQEETLSGEKEAVPAETEPSSPPEPSAAEPPPPTSFQYRIKRGDTLWDLSQTFYRTPWLYKKIARDNGIPNPDLIYAGRKLEFLED